MTGSIAHAVAEILDSALGESVSDVVFAGLVEDVLDDLAARFEEAALPEVV